MAWRRRSGRRGGRQATAVTRAARRCPTGSRTRSGAPEKIRAAKAELEAEAKAAAEAKAKEEAARRRSGKPKAARSPAGKPNRPRRARSQSPAELHRSRKPHHEDEGWLHPGLQRAGRRRCRGAGHRGAVRSSSASCGSAPLRRDAGCQRQAPAGADDRCD